MKFKKGIAMVLAVFLMVTLFGCGAAETGKEGDAGDQTIKVGVASQWMKEQVYRDVQVGAEAKAKELGISLEWQTCDGNAEKELEIVNNYITRDFDVLIIEPVNPETSTPMMEAAKAAGIPVINLEAEVKGGDGAAVRIT